MPQIPNCPTCSKPLETARVTEHRNSGAIVYPVLVNCRVLLDGLQYHDRCAIPGGGRGNPVVETEFDAACRH